MDNMYSKLFFAVYLRMWYTLDFKLYENAFICVNFGMFKFSFRTE